MSTQQPETLRLAGALAACCAKGSLGDGAATELRRLYALNQALLAVLQANGMSLSDQGDVGISVRDVGRLDAGDHFVGDPSGVGVSAVGVEILPLGFAPYGEIVRVNVNADHAHAFCLQSFATKFSGGQPLIVGPMEFVTVLTGTVES